MAPTKHPRAHSGQIWFLLPQQDTFVDTLNMNNCSVTFFLLYFINVFICSNRSRWWLLRFVGYMAEHSCHIEHSINRLLCEWEAEIENFISLLLSCLWSPSSLKCGWAEDKTFFPWCQSLNYLLVAKSTKFTPTPP